MNFRRSKLRDQSAPAPDRALAIFWIAHLVADAHQSCHAGSLYVESLFPEGDRGANSIPMKQSRNMHAMWDGLLGGKHDVRDARRRISEIQQDTEWRELGKHAAQAQYGLTTDTWLAEGLRFAIDNVYADEVLKPVRLLMANGDKNLATISLNEPYLKHAGHFARVRAAQSACRLKAILA